MATENNLWLPPLSPKDQKKLNQLRSNGKKSASVLTGFAGRTLWDWLQFLGVLAIPFVVAGATLFFTQQITQQQAQLSIAANERQHQTDIQIAQNQQQEATLQTYLDRMSDLLLNNNLCESKPEDEVRNVAQARTLTALAQLDGVRKGPVISFLYHAQLINSPKSASDHQIPIISLKNADLRDILLNGMWVETGDLYCSGSLIGSHTGSSQLSGVDLSGSNLRNASFTCVDLRNANLSGVWLINAYLTGVDLGHANLTNAALGEADLSSAYLVDADLSHANLKGTDLSYANLAGATVTNQQLNEARSLKGATMPDGSTHP